jgi:hypothetical protein
MNKKIFLSVSCFVLINLLLSCSATNTLTLNVTEPAPVLLNKNTTKIGIINRTIPTKKQEVLDAIDKILTIEGKELDKIGSNSEIISLKEELLKNSNLTNVVILDSIASKTFSIDRFSDVLPWEKIEEICSKKNIDAIYELSFFDTDSDVAYNTYTTEIKNNLGLKIPAIEHEVSVTTLIKSGWRIYDNNDKVISDVFADSKVVAVKGRGINPVKAFETIKTRKDAVLSVSRDMGRNYANRILPYSIRVTRDYYVKGITNFEIGKRRAQAGEWDSAAELWLIETNNKKAKIAGRACYNMGIINEINGDIETALKWVTKSYTDYNDKNALRYIRILKNRKLKNEQLERETN